MSTEVRVGNPFPFSFLVPFQVQFHESNCFIHLNSSLYGLDELGMRVSYTVTMQLMMMIMMNTYTLIKQSSTASELQDVKHHSKIQNFINKTTPMGPMGFMRTPPTRGHIGRRAGHGGDRAEISNLIMNEQCLLWGLWNKPLQFHLTPRALYPRTLLEVWISPRFPAGYDTS